MCSESNTLTRRYTHRNVLAAGILDRDHREWESHLPEIEVAIRNTVHSATGEKLILTVFSHHMFLDGASYKLARQLRSLGPA